MPHGYFLNSQRKLVREVLLEIASCKIDFYWPVLTGLFAEWKLCDIPRPSICFLGVSNCRLSIRSAVWLKLLPRFDQVLKTTQRLFFAVKIKGWKMGCFHIKHRVWKVTMRFIWAPWESRVPCFPQSLKRRLGFYLEAPQWAWFTVMRARSPDFKGNLQIRYVNKFTIIQSFMQLTEDHFQMCFLVAPNGTWLLMSPWRMPCQLSSRRGCEQKII